MIFSLVLGFEGKKIKNIIYRSRAKFLLHWCLQFIAALILGFSYSSISRQV